MPRSIIRSGIIKKDGISARAFTTYCSLLMFIWRGSSSSAVVEGLKARKKLVAVVGQSTLAELTGVKRGAINRAIADLLEAGWIKREMAEGHRIAYVVGTWKEQENGEPKETLYAERSAIQIINRRR